MAEEYVNKESLIKHIERSFGEISTPFVVREIKDFPTAEVVPKSKVDRLTMECFVLEQECGKFKADIKELKTEVVREIIKMIDKKIAIAGSSLGIGGRRTGKTLNVGKIIGLELIKADIKEKYLEGKYE